MTTVSTRRRFFSRFAVAGLVLAFTVTGPLPRAAAAQDPDSFVSMIGTRGIQALRPDIESGQRLARLRKLFRHDFDTAGIGLFALGRYRWQATPQEQQEYFRLYQEFIVRAFSNRLNEYGGAAFRVTGRRPSAGDTVIASELARADGGRLQLDWHVVPYAARYRVTDLGVDGVSLKITLRDRFASWIEGNGGRFGALLSVLRQQIAQLQ